jgi:hypothetical protein
MLISDFKAFYKCVCKDFNLAYSDQLDQAERLAAQAVRKENLNGKELKSSLGKA